MRKFLSTFVIVCLSLAPIAAEPPEIYCKHFFYGYPRGTPETNDLIIRDIYALSSNDRTKFADWVAYRLTENDSCCSVATGKKKKRHWKSDPWLDENETLEPGKSGDYRDAYRLQKMDRGHLAPLGSFQDTPYAHETNYLSNIAPQKTDLNRGPWKKVEESVRDLVKKKYTVYVMTGPLYDKKMPPLPGADEPHQVPGGFWKVVTIIISEKSFESYAFIFDQDTPLKNSPLKHIVSIDEVEKRSGLDLFPLLDDEREKILEKEIHAERAKKHFQN